jgi:hypothetical protein
MVGVGVEEAGVGVGEDGVGAGVDVGVWVVSSGRVIFTAIYESVVSIMQLHM